MFVSLEKPHVYCFLNNHCICALYSTVSSNHTQRGKHICFPYTWKGAFIYSLLSEDKYSFRVLYFFFVLRCHKHWKHLRRRPVGDNKLDLSSQSGAEIDWAPIVASCRGTIKGDRGVACFTRPGSERSHRVSPTTVKAEGPGRKSSFVETHHRLKPKSLSDKTYT